MKNKKKVLSANDMFNLPLEPDAHNLVNLLHAYVATSSNKDVADVVIQHNLVAQVAVLNNPAQRLNINRFLTNVMLLNRAEKGVLVHEYLPFLANDGLIEDWLTLLKTIVIPFMCEQNMFMFAYEKFTKQG